MRAGAPCSRRPSNDMCFSGDGKLTHARLMSLRVTLQYCVSAVQSSTMVGEPAAVRYVTVDICQCVKNREKATSRSEVRGWGGLPGGAR